MKTYDNMLFKEIEDCENNCPFAVGEIYADLCDHTGSPDGNAPCLQSDIFCDKTIEEVVGILYDINAQNNMYMQQKLEDKLKKEQKLKQQAERRRESAKEVRYEDMLIRKIKKRISANNCAVRLMEDMSLFSGKLDTDKRDKILIENETLGMAIKNIENIRREKLKQLSKKRRHKK